MIRPATGLAELDAYARVWCAVHPDSPISAEEMHARLAGRNDGRRYFVAELAGRTIGVGFASGGTSVPGRASLAVAVLPDDRRRGVGSGLLRAALAHAASLGARHAIGTVGVDGLPWAERRGFAEIEREVELVLDLRGDERAGEPPSGIRVEALDDAHFHEAFAVYAEGVGDMPDADEYVVTRERFAQEVAEAPLALVALDGEHVVGYAALERRTDDVLGHQLTAVARAYRRRGIARALKEAQIGWAANHGVRRLITDTHIDNVATQRLNERLGYVAQPPLVLVRKELE